MAKNFGIVGPDGKIVDVVITGGKARLAIDAAVSIETVEVLGEGTILFNELFLNDSLDIIDKWTEIIVGSATKTISDNIIKLSTTTASGDDIVENSTQKFAGNLAASFTLVAGVRLGDTGKTGNSRAWGVNAGGPNDVLIFVLEGTKFFARTAFDGTKKEVDITASLPTDGEFHGYSIKYKTASDAEFFIDGVSVATIVHAVNPLLSDKNLNIHIRNINTGATASASDSFIESITLVDDSRSGITIIGQQEDSTILRIVGVDNKGRLLISGEVGTVTRADNPIFISIAKSLATGDEVILVDKNVDAGQTWFITSATLGNEHKSKMRVYKGLERNRNELFSGDGVTTDFILTAEAVPIASKIVVKVDTVTQALDSDYIVKDDPADDTKSIIEFQSGSIPPSGTDNIDVTYDATDRVSVVLGQVDTTFQETWGAPLKLLSSLSQFIIVTVQNGPASSADASLNLNGFFEVD